MSATIAPLASSAGAGGMSVSFASRTPLTAASSICRQAAGEGEARPRLPRRSGLRRTPPSRLLLYMFKLPIYKFILKVLARRAVGQMGLLLLVIKVWAVCLHIVLSLPALRTHLQVVGHRRLRALRPTRKL